MNGVRLAVGALALLVGLAGIFLAVAVRQVPPGQQLEIQGAFAGPGIHLAPIWLDAKVLPPDDLPRIDVPESAPAADAQARLDDQLAKAWSTLDAAEAAVKQTARQDVDAEAGDVRAEQAQFEARRAELERRIAALETEARHIVAQREAEAEAEAVVLLAAGQEAVARAEARRDALLGEILASPAGRYYLAIEAARAFRLGDVHLPAPRADFLQTMGSVSAWRAFFLGGD